ncbi:MAG TPA: DUF6048 family protein [Chryseolinea sp.]|nr:DUF6048 family protein [Chryseolinea sp.]
MKLHLSIYFILSVFIATAQKADTVKEKHSYIPTGIRVGTDVISIIKSSTDKTFNGWEVNSDIDFYRYYFVVDYGYWARNYTSFDGDYSNNGTYFRVGADVNFLKKDPDKNIFFFGLRYGRSIFSEDLTVSRFDPVWGQIDDQFINTNVPASWFEVTTGLRVKIWRFIWMGYTARLKFALSTGDTPDMKPHDVPGYGRTDKESYWGFNYQVFVRFPVRKSEREKVKVKSEK